MLSSSLLSGLVAVGAFVMSAKADIPIRFVSYNIRYAASNRFEGEAPWSTRKPLVLNNIKYNTLYNDESFVCLQEVLDVQLQDLLKGLGDDWDYVGVGRDNGMREGEFSPILYRKSAWKVQKAETKWLSETPDVPSKGWDASNIRIVTIGTFSHVKTSKRVVGMCTHFDDQGKIARAESAKEILALVEANAYKSSRNARYAAVPVFLAGDLNSPPSDEGFQILNDENGRLQVAKERAGWRYGNANITYTGFNEKEEKTDLDHVFLTREESFWDVKGFSVLPNQFDGGVYSSDHRAVVVDAVLKR